MFRKKVDELEFYFKNFPDIPREVILKEDLLRLGVWFTEEAINIARISSTGSDRDLVHSTTKTKYDKLQSHNAVNIPLSLWIEGGVYKLRRIIVENRLSFNSPYLIDVIDGQITLLADGIPIAKVKYPEVPEYYSKRCTDGTWYHQIISMNSWTMYAFDVALNYCQLWGKKVECKFCDINKHIKQKQPNGITADRTISNKSVNKVGEVAKDIFYGHKQPENNRTLAVFITGGTIIDKVDNKDENRFYLDHIETIRKNIGYRWPLILQTQAKTKEECKIFRDAGVDVHCANIEVWDQKLFRWLCPGKDTHIGRDEWIKRVIDSVDVFGEGNVAPNFVTGVEMAKPHGFADVAAAIKSTSEGLDFLMSHGVVPKFDTWNISPWSLLAANGPPPLEYYIRIDQIWCELWQKYDLPPITAMGAIGPGRSQNYVSAHNDMDSVVSVTYETA